MIKSWDQDSRQFVYRPHYGPFIGDEWGKGSHYGSIKMDFSDKNFWFSSVDRYGICKIAYIFITSDIFIVAAIFMLIFGALLGSVILIIVAILLILIGVAMCFLVRKAWLSWKRDHNDNIKEEPEKTNNNNEM